MTDRIARMRQFFIVDKSHRAVRQPIDGGEVLARGFAEENLPDYKRAARRLQYMLQTELPVLFEDESLVFTRTVPEVPVLFTMEEMQILKKNVRLHESGELSNISVDYGRFLQAGFTGMRQKVVASQERFAMEGNVQKMDYLDAMLDVLEAVADLVERYRQAALRKDKPKVAQTLANLLAGPPQTLREALQMQRIIHFAMWSGGNYHNTLGRFDQYMLPYYEKDLAEGRLDEESALELLEEYFLSFNRDSDLYPGMQQGDNGQSMVLGGATPEGGDGFNALSRLCLQASLELKLIDPKMNLRVGKDTPLEVYRLGTELTKQGLGFPQYSGDDVVVEGLEKLGYATEDARNYVVAACWEFIIPGKGMEIPNIDALCFAGLVRDTVVRHLEDSASYEELFAHLRQAVQKEADRICEGTGNLYIFPSPFLSLMMEGCVENARDVTLGCVYNNYGIHGTGLATAVDSLAAVKRYVYDEGKVDKAKLLAAMDSDFAGEDELLNLLRFQAPKFGNNDEETNAIAGALLDSFAAALEGKRNQRGGIFRAGTGSAMYYLWHAKNMGATPDGRRAGEGLSANYSPSLFSRCKGPVSILQAFASPHLARAINGGPLTMELHDTLFRDEESIAKVAAMVKSFFDLGGHQMQINAVNRDTMLAAQKNPEEHRGLIVRVWGWSGYFVELDKEYQDHIIQRMELMV